MIRYVPLAGLFALATFSVLTYAGAQSLPVAAPTPVPTATPIVLHGPVVVPAFPSAAPDLRTIQLQSVPVLRVPDFTSANQAAPLARAESGNIGEATGIDGTPLERAARLAALHASRDAQARQWLKAHPDAVSVTLRAAPR